MFKRRKPEDVPVPSAPPVKAGQPGPAREATNPAQGLLDGASVDPSVPGVNQPAYAGKYRPDPTPLPTSPARRPEPGFGVPPFRPAAKEAPAMGRSPFPAPPAPPNSMPAPGMAAAPGVPTPPSQSITSQAVRPGMPPSRVREPAERRTLVVGRGISVQGVVTDAERLVVEGTIEATMIHATELVIALGGIFKGEVEVEDTEIAGTIDGTLTARGNLIVRASGKVLGTARCRRLQVEDGGQITGRIEMITGPAASETVRAEQPSAPSAAA